MIRASESIPASDPHPGRPVSTKGIYGKRNHSNDRTPRLRRPRTVRRYGQRVSCSSPARGRTIQLPERLSGYYPGADQAVLAEYLCHPPSRRHFPRTGVSFTVILLEETDFAGMNEE